MKIIPIALGMAFIVLVVGGIAIFDLIHRRFFEKCPDCGNRGMVKKHCDGWNARRCRKCDYVEQF